MSLLRPTFVPVGKYRIMDFCSHPEVIEHAIVVTRADVAQLVEQSIRNRQVIGSSPIVGSSAYPTHQERTTAPCDLSVRMVLGSHWWQLRPIPFSALLLSSLCSPS